MTLRTNDPPASNDLQQSVFEIASLLINLPFCLFLTVLPCLVSSENFADRRI